MSANQALLAIVGGEFSSAAAIEGPPTSPDQQAAAPADPAPSTSPAAPTPRIGPQHVDLLKLISEGAFGKVILVRNRLNKSLHATKAISKKLLRKKNIMQYMKSERDILSTRASRASACRRR